MRKVLITGASGFVGNNVARRLLGQGHEVHCILRRGTVRWRLDDILGDLKVHEVDLRDASSLQSAVDAVRPEWVFHLAAYGAYSSQTEVGRILETNFVGTVNLLHACLRTGFEVFVNTGSSSEYGFKGHAPRETDFPEPNSDYAVAKASATLFCGYIARSRRVRVPTLRLYSAYGPYEEPTRLIPTLVLQGLRKRLPPLVHPDIARDFVYIDDVVEAFLLAATVGEQEPAAIYNVGTGIQTTIEEVVDISRRLLNITEEPTWASMEDRIWDTGTWVADAGLIREKLGWRPSCSFEEGFGRTITWIKDNLSLMEAFMAPERADSA
jgi:UDP-glucose 4-epimerase